MEIFCFGSFRLCIRGRNVHIGNKKAAELLAYLVWQNKPVKKTKLASVLWPDSETHKAMDNLYKVCQYLHAFQDGILPLNVQREVIWLEKDLIVCDTHRFDEYYSGFPDINCCVKAVSLHEAPFLLDECYEWSEVAEAYYDIRNLEMLEFLADYYTQTGNFRLAGYYRKKME